MLVDVSSATAARRRYTLAACSTLALSSFYAAVIQAAPMPRAVRIDAGKVTGTPSPNPAVIVFKGIPFAAPPVGALRWKPPIPPAKWNGMLKADHYRPACIQKSRENDVVGNEDCLYLNVWMPANTKAAKLPVMLWFFGGGFSTGSGSLPGFEAVGLANQGVIVVSINYRLGLLGFLSSPDLDAESPRHVSGNYGLLDQVEALNWVKRNASAFHGDANRVTIFGQSAGGGSVQFMSVSPLARGLFQRAIAQSATMDPGDPLLWQGAMSYRTLKEAETNDWYYLRGVGIDSMAKLRSMTAEQIINLPPPPFPPFPPFFDPVLDGQVLPATFNDTYAQHRQADVPFLQGTSAEDLSGTPTFKTTLAAYRKWAQEKFGPMTDEFIRLYPAVTDDEAGLAQNLAFHDQNRISKVGWADRYQTGIHSKIFVYFWNHPWPGQESRGAFHGSEIPYIMGSLASEKPSFTDEDREISDMMSRYWANFAATGDPNGIGLPNWPTFARGAPKTTMQLGDNPGPIDPATAARTDFFIRWFGTRPQM